MTLTYVADFGGVHLVVTHAERVSDERLRALTHEAWQTAQEQEGPDPA